MAGLIITNGDDAAELLRLAGREEAILPWRDVLHEGPIVETVLETCSQVRVEYFARRFRIDASEVAAEFAARDAVMRAHADYDTIELWFEHDLYDQLQLVQVLAFFAGEARSEGISIVQADDFLGHQTPETVLAFAERRRSAEQAHLDLAAGVWADLLAATPEPIAARTIAASRLPFLKPALARFLEELPSAANGLNRTEQAILEEIDAGTRGPAALFPAVLGREEAAFMGDWSFFRVLDDLASCDVPLIAGLAPPAEGVDDAERLADAELKLTMAGDDVLSGEEDHVALSGIDRWWAGTHLLGRSVWRYDRDAASLVPPGATVA